MKGLLIKDKTHWCDSWSAKMATHLEIHDSTYNLLIFHQQHTSEDILPHIAEAPPEIFQIIDLEESSEDDCDIIGDSGAFYKLI